MNTFFGVFLAVLTLVAVARVAPVVADYQAAKERAVASAAYKQAEHQRNIEACAAGKSQSYIYNGVHCKGFN